MATVEGTKKYNIHIEDLTAGTTFVIDGITIEVLRVKNENITANAGNNTSCVFRIGDAGRKILFLGDLGVEGGRELLASPYAKWLKADYVQMAHHGQAGVEKDVYAAIGAKICLWTTPLSKNSAEWQNFKTKKWMAELGATKDYVMSDGLLEIK